MLVMKLLHAILALQAGYAAAGAKRSAA